MNRNIGINRLTPFLTTGSNVVPKFSGVSSDPNDHFSVGAFKPFCGGWSFKKTAEKALKVVF